MSTRKKFEPPTAEQKARQERMKKGDTRVRRDDEPRRDAGAAAPGAWRDRPAAPAGQSQGQDRFQRPGDGPNRGPSRPYGDRPQDGPGPDRDNRGPYNERPQDGRGLDRDNRGPYNERPQQGRGPDRDNRGPYNERPQGGGQQQDNPWGQRRDDNGPQHDNPWGQQREGRNGGRGADADGNVYMQRRDQQDRQRAERDGQRFDGPPRGQGDYGGQRNDGPRNFDGPRRDGPPGNYGGQRNDGPRNFDGPRRDGPPGNYGGQRNDGPRNFDGPRRDGPPGNYGGQRNDGPPRGPGSFDRDSRRDDNPWGQQRSDGPPRGSGNFGGPRNDGPRNFDGPRRDGPQGGFGGPRNDGPRNLDGPRRDGPQGGFGGPRNDGPRNFDGPRRDGPQGGFGGPRNDGPRNFDGPRRDGPPGDQRRFDGPPRGPRNFDGPRHDGPRNFDAPRNQDGPRPFDRDDRGGPQGPPEEGAPRRGPGPIRQHHARPRTTGRDVAAFTVMRVVEDGAFSNLALRTTLRESGMDRRDRAFATRLTYGTLTWLGYIDGVLNAMLPKGLHSLPSEVASHLRVAMYQLLKDRDHTPVHAAIDECVNLVGNIEPALRGLTNGVLRNFERGREDILETVRERFPIEVELSLSPAVAAQLKKRVPKDMVTEIMARWNDATPVVVRSRGLDRDALAALLSEADDVTCEPHALAPDALIFQGDIRQVINHSSLASVQDAGAQIVAYTLPPDLDGTVIDACAGLGGKALHLLDQLKDVNLVVCDIDKRKLARIPDPEDEDRLVRIPGDMSIYEGAEAVALHAASQGMNDGYAAIVIDAPCSALGTLGRHPEVRWLRTNDDIAQLMRVQQNLLKTMAPLVRPGGYLVYVVCTFTEAETLRQVDRFLQAHPDYVLSPPTAEDADPRVDWESIVDDTKTISLWPVPHNTDGFFIARFQKSANGLVDMNEYDDDYDEDEEDEDDDGGFGALENLEGLEGLKGLDAKASEEEADDAAEATDDAAEATGAVEVTDVKAEAADPVETTDAVEATDVAAEASDAVEVTDDATETSEVVDADAAAEATGASDDEKVEG